MSARSPLPALVQPHEVVNSHQLQHDSRFERPSAQWLGPGDQLGSPDHMGEPLPSESPARSCHQISVPVRARTVRQWHEEAVAVRGHAQRGLIAAPTAPPHMGQQPQRRPPRSGDTASNGVVGLQESAERAMPEKRFPIPSEQPQQRRTTNEGTDERELISPAVSRSRSAYWPAHGTKVAHVTTGRN